VDVLLGSMKPFSKNYLKLSHKSEEQILKTLLFATIPENTLSMTVEHV